MLTLHSANNLRGPRLSARWVLATSLLIWATACNNPERVSAGDRRAISDSLQALVVAAHDFSQPAVLNRLIALYPDSGRVISVAAGRIVSTKPALEAEITSFWQRVGQNMKGPKFEMGSVYVDVLTRNSAVMTFSYSIPHTTPAGRPHRVTGAWTALWRLQEGRWMIVQEHLSDAPEVTTTAVTPDSAPPPAVGHNMSDHVRPGGSKK